MKIKLFYSYSHKNETDRDELEKHLTALKKNGLIDQWHDRKITAGDNWDEKINNEMNDAHIILLLFSPDFIASDSCQKEVKSALSLKKEKGTIFIPIILKACAWKDVEGISDIQALPEDARPVNQWDDKDDAWHNIYKKIKEKVEDMRNKIKPTLNDSFSDDRDSGGKSNVTLGWFDYLVQYKTKESIVDITPTAEQLADGITKVTRQKRSNSQDEVYRGIKYKGTENHFDGFYKDEAMTQLIQTAFRSK